MLIVRRLNPAIPGLAENRLLLVTMPFQIRFQTALVRIRIPYKFLIPN